MSETTPISFTSGGAQCKGLSFSPTTDALKGPDGYPCVVMGHGFGATVDCGLDTYANRFAETGMRAIAFDYRHFGLSEGEPRQLLSIGKQLEDWQAALAYARSLPDIDSSKGRQIRDFLEIVTLGASTRIDALSQRSDLDEPKSNIYKIFKKTNDSFSSIQDNMDQQVITISELFLSFEENLMATCARANISKSHSDLIKLILHDAKSELNLVLTSSLTMDEHFMNVMMKLEKAYCPERDDT